MKITRHFVYWLLPGLYLLALIGMYFSGNPTLQEIVAPSFNREFGLLEQSQNLLLLAIVAAGVVGYRRASTPFERLMFAGLIGMGSWMFLEENDYGLHVWEWARNVPIILRSQARNLHNIKIDGIGRVTDLFKWSIDFGMVFLFVILPLIGSRIRRPWIRYFTQDPLIMAGFFCSLLLSRLAHLIDDLGWNSGGSIAGNMSEFRECFTYYLVLVYWWELARHRRWPGFSAADTLNGKKGSISKVIRTST